MVASSVVKTTARPVATTIANSDSGGGVPSSFTEFNGTSDIITSPAIDLTSTNIACVSVWLNANSYDGTQVIFELSDNFNNYADSFGVFIAGSGIYIANKGDVGYSTASYAPQAVGQWFHMLVVFDASKTTNECDLYIGGQLITPSAREFNENNSNNFGNRAASIGARFGGSLFFSGKMFDLGVYARELTPTEKAILASLSTNTVAADAVYRAMT